MNGQRVLAAAATLALAVAWSDVALAQVRKPGEAAKPLARDTNLAALGIPDLTCTIVVSDDQAGTSPIPQGRTIALGSRLWVHFTVWNKGVGPAEGFVSYVKVEKYLSYPGSLVHEEKPTQQPLTLGPGQSAKLPPIPVDLDPAMDNKIKARMYADYGNAVTETDDVNNWCNLDFTAQGSPPSKSQQQMASQAAQNPAQTPLAVNRTRPGRRAAGDEGGKPGAEPGDEPGADAYGMLADPKALTTPHMADLSCTVHGSKYENGTEPIPNGGSITINTDLAPKVVYLQVTVRNTGKVQAAGVVAKVAIEKNGMPTEESSKTLIVGPGLSYKWPIPVALEGTGLTPHLSGSNHIQATVVNDEANTVSEANETNNPCGAQFTVEWHSGSVCPLCGLGGDP